jgi:hypothetical protein
MTLVQVRKQSIAETQNKSVSKAHVLFLPLPNNLTLFQRSYNRIMQDLDGKQRKTI